MIKTKPALHIKPGDTLIFYSWDKREFSYQVAKASYDGDTDTMQVTFPAKHLQLSSGARIETEPKSTLGFNPNEQVHYQE